MDEETEHVMNFVPQWHDNAIRITVAVILSALMAFCLGCSARSDDLQAARQRLQAIESAKQQAELAAIAKQAIVEQTAKAAEEESPFEPAFEPTPNPIPDPISQRKAPTIQFAVSQTAEKAPRFPRAVLVCGQGCAPCLRTERENAELIGGPDMPIQLVQNWLANDLDEWGITPGMQLGTPYLFILEEGHKVHALTLTGLQCALRGYQSPEVIRDYLTKHGVSLEVSSEAVVATVDDAEAGPEAAVAAVLAEHLIRVAGGRPMNDEEQAAWDAKMNQHVVGSLFDFSLDVPDSLKAFAAKLLTAQRYEFGAAGITVDWSGPSRSFVVNTAGITITPGAKVTLNKWLIQYSCSLDGINYTPDLSTVTLLLTGAPDLQVHLK